MFIVWLDILKIPKWVHCSIRFAVTDVYQTPEWKRAYMYALTIAETSA